MNWYRLSDKLRLSSLKIDNLMTTSPLACIYGCINYTPPVIGLLLLSTSLLSFFAFVILLPLTMPVKIITIGLVACLFIMFMYSFNAVIISNPGHVAKDWQDSELSSITNLSIETLNETIPLQNFNLEHSFTSQLKYNGEERYCKKCMLSKPDRAHHCSICKRCVLRMDHHCPWVMNCIGFGNYKLFLVFIFWGFVYSLTIMILMIALWQTTPPFFIYTQGTWFTISSVVLFITSISFSLSFLGFLLFHTYLIYHGKTSLENIIGYGVIKGVDEIYQPNENPFKRSFKIHFLEIFGNNPYLWVIPVNNGCRGGYNFSILQDI
jgi:palmitoyltransferase ZDHHC2/15/20